MDGKLLDLCLGHTAFQINKLLETHVSSYPFRFHCVTGVFPCVAFFIRPEQRIRLSRLCTFLKLLSAVNSHLLGLLRLCLFCPQFLTELHKALSLHYVLHLLVSLHIVFWATTLKAIH